MKLKELTGHLQSLEGFGENPKIIYEQYATPPSIASHILYTAQSSFEDLEGKSVADLGCGFGILAIGASLMGAGQVVAVDIDRDALSIALHNARDLDLPIEFILSDIEQFHSKHTFDTVLLNPPFGTKTTKGADVAFLRKAMSMASNAIYSLHKTTTRKHILDTGKREGWKGSVVAELRYDLPATYKFHKKTSVDIQVDLIRFAPSE